MSLFRRVKSWFHKDEPEYQDSYQTEGADVLVEDVAEAAAESPEYAGDYAQATPEAIPDYAAEIAPAPEPAAPVPSAKPSQIQVPLAPIVAALPQDLRDRLLVDNVGDASVFIALESILPQLARGQACITFGELREASPGAFSTTTDLDERKVHLPLSVVLPRITPDMLARKQSRQQFDIPDEIVSPFANMGRGLAIADVKRGSAATASRALQPETDTAPLVAAHAAAPAPMTAAVPQRSAPVPAVASQPRPTATPAANLAALRAGARSATTLSAAQPRPAAPPRPGSPATSGVPRQPTASGVPPVATRPVQPAAPQPAPLHSAAASRAAGQGPLPMPGARPAGVPLSSLPRAATPASTPPQALHPSAPTPAAPRVISGAGLPQPSAAAPRAISGAGLPQPTAPIPSAPRPLPATGLPLHPQAAVPAPAPTPARLEEQPPVLVLMSAISEFWPDSIKEEVVLLQATSSKVGLPFSAVEAGLRKGRLCFSWQQLRSWLRPAVPHEASAQDTVQLELPLRTVAPLFIAQQKARGQAQPRVAVDMTIPDLFSGGEEAKPETPTDHAVTRPVDTNFYVWEDETNKEEAVQAEQQRVAQMSETEFLRRASTPNEVVTRAVALEGVEGAVIALPDGLAISSKVPAHVNSDTIAAFLPQLYGKVSQCTQELRMGELNNLKFTVGNVPWKVYRVNALYFAAFGKTGKPLPGAPLHALARELDRRGKE